MQLGNIILLLFIFVFILLGNKCTSSKMDHGSCDQIGIIRDYSGLDGCQWMIESNGKKYQPILDGNLSFEFKRDQKITFSYSNYDGMGICMAGQMIKISCITEL